MQRRLLLLRHDLKVIVLYRMPSLYHRVRGRWFQMVGRIYLERAYLYFHLRLVASEHGSPVRKRLRNLRADFRWTRSQWQSETLLTRDY